MPHRRVLLPNITLQALEAAQVCVPSFVTDQLAGVEKWEDEIGGTRALGVVGDCEGFHHFVVDVEAEFGWDGEEAAGGFARCGGGCGHCGGWC